MTTVVKKKKVNSPGGAKKFSLSTEVKEVHRPSIALQSLNNIIQTVTI